MENNKYKKIIIILSVILVVLLLAFGGLYLYRTIKNRGRETRTIPIQHGSVDTNKKEEKVTLDEEDVKNWLDSHFLIEFFYIAGENDFNYDSANEKDYGNALMEYLIFNRDKIIIESKAIGPSANTGYDYQYTYNLSSAKEMLNDYFGVGIDKINANIINEIYKEYANIDIQGDTIVIKILATGRDMFDLGEVNKIYLNSDNNIIVRYNLKNCIPDGRCELVGQREIVLKKTDTGYNILKAYKVES